MTSNTIRVIAISLVVLMMIGILAGAQSLGCYVSTK